MAKASAKVVPLDKSYGYNSAVVDHTSGKATVSELRFAGKKFVLEIGATDKAQLSSGMAK